MSTENVVICTPGRSDDEPEPYYSPEKTMFEEMCEKTLPELRSSRRKSSNCEGLSKPRRRSKSRRRTPRVMQWRKLMATSK
ncbi:hypothetical protein ANCCAN_30199 [Ancylostoma caninum]|uniref:Uncharacterized protein n=1 Tax=Ancylostoma caninum TaxID=29170 RepID=A0A368EWK4_ANCCA|nr:hypothetical protein ANCCAN_30199 [Ancylostoma caninum]